MTATILLILLGSLLLGVGLITLIAAAAYGFTRALHAAPAPSAFEPSAARTFAWVRIGAWSSILILTGTFAFIRLGTMGMWIRIGLLFASLLLSIWAQVQLSYRPAADLEQHHTAPPDAQE